MKLYNTLTGTEEQFVPANGMDVNMYVCGVTPYSSTHVGHALSYVIFDVLKRYLSYCGYKVKHIQNFTDVDDKIIQKSHDEGITENELVTRYIGDFFTTMDALNVQRADEYPRATQEIPRIIETIEGLIDKGFAYPVEGDVYFRVTQSGDYGKLSHRTLDGMIAGARIQIEENKENPMDFALWKGAKTGEPSWESPWGPGRPGWHIECTTMSIDNLGASIDIHGGGQDLIFPHHENEIAQSEAYTGVKPFSRYWIHNGLLQFGQDKMSKSIGNLVSVEEALTHYSADTLRVYFLSSHYRSPLTYSDEGALAIERSIDRFHYALSLPHAAGPPLDYSEYESRFKQAMEDDMNTPQAIASLFDLAREINRSQPNGIDVTQAQAALRNLGGILGLTFASKQVNDSNDVGAGAFIQMLLDIRNELRSNKQYDLSDKIRDMLVENGVQIEDTPEGAQWSYTVSRE